MRSLIFALALAPLFAAASPLPDFPFVYVYGSAKREVAPDRATISFRVQSYDAEAERAFRQQSEIAGVVLDFAAKLGLSGDNIVAQAIEKSASRRKDPGREFEIIGYECVRSVTIQINDLASFPKIIEFLYEQAHIEGLSVTFGCKDAGAILQSLTDDACKAASENAERLSRGFQKKLAGVRAISENGFSGIGTAFGFIGDEGRSYSALMTSPNRDFRVIPSTISFQKGIYAIFAIE